MSSAAHALLHTAHPAQAARALNGTRAVQPAPVIDNSTALTGLMRPLKGYLDAPGVIEVVINRPGEVWVETYKGWQKFEDQAIQFKELFALARAVATFTSQRTGEQSPLLSASLPTGERIQIAQPPATKAGIICIALRKPSDTVRRLTDLAADGLFSGARERRAAMDETEKRLIELERAGRHDEFLQQAVLARKTIVLAGATGSGKTTVMKSLAEEIPLDQRLITIEDAEEVRLPSHGNKMHLFYSKGGQGVSTITANSLLESCMRFRPDRILLAEVRGEEAFSFLDIAASGHPGSMTTIHAGCCDEAIERMALLVRKSGAGGGMTMPEIKQLAESVIDVVAHFGRSTGSLPVMTELRYRPRFGAQHGQH